MALRAHRQSEPRRPFEEIFGNAMQFPPARRLKHRLGISWDKRLTRVLAVVGATVLAYRLSSCQSCAEHERRAEGWNQQAPERFRSTVAYLAAPHRLGAVLSSFCQATPGIDPG